MGQLVFAQKRGPTSELVLSLFLLAARKIDDRAEMTAAASASGLP